MNSKRNYGRAWTVFLGLCLAAVVSIGNASAEVTVSGPYQGVVTGGDWTGVYGECFYLLPSPSRTGEELPIGPDLFSSNHGQYVSQNCYGGPMFSNSAHKSQVDWRIFRNGDPANAFAFRAEDTREGSAQYNPCLDETRHATWDNDTFDTDPMTVELVVKAGGNAELAYYFVNGDVACRGLDYFLAIDGEVRASGYIEDFAEGKYVVFDVDGLVESEAGTVISFWAQDAEGLADCAPPADGGYDTNENTHISGLFVGGDICASVCDDDDSSSDSSSGSSSDDHSSEGSMGSDGSSDDHSSEGSMGSDGSSEDDDSEGSAGSDGSSDDHSSEGSAGSDGSSEDDDSEGSAGSDGSSDDHSSGDDDSGFATGHGADDDDLKVTARGLGGGPMAFASATATNSEAQPAPEATPRRAPVKRATSLRRAGRR